MDITIFLFDDVTALDVVGPYEALRRLPDVRIQLAGIERGSIETGGHDLRLQANAAISEIDKTDLLLIPGGGADGIRRMMAHANLLNWVRQLHVSTRWTTSVCSGSLLLGAAGLLKGLSVSTHWRAKAALPMFGATYSERRITEAGKIITAAGVSAGIDMGIHLCDLIAGTDIARAIQLSMEYRPEPPFTVSTPENEPRLVEIVDKVLHS